MVNSQEHPEVLNLLEVSNPPFGKASFMNTLKVDFEKYPYIAKIPMFKIALLGPGKIFFLTFLGCLIFSAGDCIYIPAGWVFQSNIVSIDNSLELKWKPEPWTPDEECVKGFTKRMLSTISFPGENYKGVDTTRDQEEVLIKKLEKVMDKVLTTDRRKLNFERFSSVIIPDETLLPDLQVNLFSSEVLF